MCVILYLMLTNTACSKRTCRQTLHLKNYMLTNTACLKLTCIQSLQVKNDMMKKSACLNFNVDKHFTQ